LYTGFEQNGCGIGEAVLLWEGEIGEGGCKGLEKRAQRKAEEECSEFVLSNGRGINCSRNLCYLLNGATKG
jgi:hypothetical protein